MKAPRQGATRRGVETYNLRVGGKMHLSKCEDKDARWRRLLRAAAIIATEASRSQAGGTR